MLWETTAQAEIPGMPMKLPAYTAKYCSKEEWTKPPDTSKDASQNCRHTSFEQTPAKVTWTMTCDNPPMTGDGEINFNGTDAYTGFVKMDAEQMSMQINLTGKKIGSATPGMKGTRTFTNMKVRVPSQNLKRASESRFVPYRPLLQSSPIGKTTGIRKERNGP